MLNKSLFFTVVVSAEEFTKVIATLSGGQWQIVGLMWSLHDQILAALQGGSPPPASWSPMAKGVSTP